MTWEYNGVEVTEPPEGAVGFVYLITNQTNNRKYIGKKLFVFSKTTSRVIKLKNGNKKRKKFRSVIPSDWQEYYGSSNELTADITLLGKDKFKREILYYCESKAEASYIEAREQYSRRVLESRDYYNSQIYVRCHRTHVGKLKGTFNSYGNT